MMGRDETPVLVEVLRNGVVESRHHGSFVVVDSGGRVIRAAGPVAAPIFPRSAIKPIQALPLIESGAAARFGFTAREIALACASHRGEAAHVAAVAAVLGRAGLAEADLECGPHQPLGAEAALALARAGGVPGRLHNNCSGKHAGFLCTALHLGEATRGYIGRDHPVQRHVTEAIGAMTGAEMGSLACGCDGCGIPTYALPLQALALGMARLADPSDQAAGRRTAIATILDAMAAEPFFVEGTGSFVTDCLAVAGGTVRLKAGAEGVHAAALPGLGYGIALKIEDGAARAADVAMGALLRSLDVLDAAAETALAAHLDPVLRNAAGDVVGSLRATTLLRG